MKTTLTGWEIGTIIAITENSVNGYVAVRREGDRAFDVEGNSVRINSYIFGNTMNIPEDSLTLTEVLLPLEVRDALTNPNDLIGRRVRVYIESGIPKFVSLYAADGARIADPEDIRKARRLSGVLGYINDVGKRFLKDIGYTDSEIDLTIRENIGNYNINGKVLKYGSQANSYSVSSSEGSASLDIGESLPIARDVPATRLKEKNCHIHIKAFSAK